MTTAKRVVKLNTLYQVIEHRDSETALNKGGKRITPHGGTVSVYHSDSMTQPVNLTDMILSAKDTDIAGVADLNPIMTDYIAFTGTATEITMAGFGLAKLGSIS